MENKVVTAAAEQVGDPTSITLCPMCGMQGVVTALWAVGSEAAGLKPSCEIHGVMTIEELSSSMAEWEKVGFALNRQTQPHFGNGGKP